MRRKFMSMALTAAMVLSMAATPVFAEDTASDEGFNLNLSQLLDRLSPGKRPRTKMVQLLTLLNFVTESNGLMDRL